MVAMMFRWFVRLFPLFIVEWMSRKWSERFWICGDQYAMPFQGVLFSIGDSVDKRRTIRSNLEIKIASAMAEMRLLKERHPELRCKFTKQSRESLLLAWRDGDITLHDCVTLLENASPS